MTILEREVKSQYINFRVTPSFKRRVEEAARRDGMNRWQPWAETVLARAAAGDIQIKLIEVDSQNRQAPESTSNPTKTHAETREVEATR